MLIRCSRCGGSGAVSGGRKHGKQPASAWQRGTTHCAWSIPPKRKLDARSSFSEALRGKPDHYVARAVRAALRVAAGEYKALEQRLLLTSEVVLERRFIKGKA